MHGTPQTQRMPQVCPAKSRNWRVILMYRFSLPCQHMFCNDCLSKLRPVAEGDRDIESIRCPQCRELCQRDEPELVEYTASEQWDALLDVAKRWARMDTRREGDTSEEEDEEEFIDDGENETR